MEIGYRGRSGGEAAYIISALKNVREFDVPREDYPKFVIFGDIKDVATVRSLYSPETKSYSFESLGPGVDVKGFKIETAYRWPDYKILEYLPWLKEREEFIALQDGRDTRKL